MQTTCPNCGYTQRASMDDAAPERIEHAKQIASEHGIEIWPGNFVRETDAAALLGLTASALRKQVTEGRNEVDFIQRGNRRPTPWSKSPILFKNFCALRGIP